MSRLWYLPAAAWAMLLAAAVLGLGLHDHHAIFEGGESPWAVAGAVMLFVVGWQIMVLAMMVPSTIGSIEPSPPMAVPTNHLSAGRFLVGYVGVWTAGGIVLLAADGSLHQALENAPAIAERPWLVTGAILLASGAWQLTPARRRCLRIAREELAAATNADIERRSSFELGAAHGMACLGSCGVLMLAVIALGSGAISIIGMIVASALVYFEKTGSRGEQLATATGAVLVCSGAALVLVNLG